MVRQSAARLTGLCFVHADVAAHPLDVLQVINGLLLVGFAGHVDKAKATLASGFAIQRQAAFLDRSIFSEKAVEIFLFAIPGEIADVDGQKKLPVRRSTLARSALGCVYQEMVVVLAC